MTVEKPLGDSYEISIDGEQLTFVCDNVTLDSSLSLAEDASTKGYIFFDHNRLVYIKKTDGGVISVDSIFKGCGSHPSLGSSVQALQIDASKMFRGMGI